MSDAFGHIADEAQFPLATEPRYRVGENPASSDLVGDAQRVRPGKSLLTNLLGEDDAFVSLTLGAYNVLPGINVEPASWLGLRFGFMETSNGTTGRVWIAFWGSFTGVDQVPMTVINGLTNPVPAGGPSRASGGGPPDFPGVIKLADSTFQYMDHRIYRFNRAVFNTEANEPQWRHCDIPVASFRSVIIAIWPEPTSSHTFSGHVGFILASHGNGMGFQI